MRIFCSNAPPSKPAFESVVDAAFAARLLRITSKSRASISSADSFPGERASSSPSDFDAFICKAVLELHAIPAVAAVAQIPLEIVLDALKAAEFGANQSQAIARRLNSKTRSP
eukprot:CAMPEP_0185829164 /NCGR_PEP_ID=MMETSP1353-20130828/86_1 /TAXON_ID=1077150 /ORGANISM="Erythrolobus australicus, Strain CCMP3124" /LENGTH=112 /DNA_ID=CAMNT_0028526925 /DNA_START=121 /DNA_END=456 /DNA_ORIENTATION=-